MILIEKAEHYRECNCCHKNNESVVNITFRYEGTNTGLQVALCQNCANELVQEIQKYYTIKGSFKK